MIDATDGLGSDSGDLPEGWATCALPQVFELNPGKPASTALPDAAPVSFVPMPAVDADRGVITEPVVRPFSEVRKAYTAFRDGDVIMAKITPCMENGKAAIARGLRNGLGFGSSEFHVFRAGGAVLAEFLFRYIRQESFRRAAASEMTGSVGQKRVPADYLKSVVLPVPPLAEQHRIVSAIDAMLAEVGKSRSMLAAVPALLQRFRQSVLAAACSGRLTEGWREANTGLRPPSPVLASSGNRRRRQGANLSGDGELNLDDTLPELPESWAYMRADRVVQAGTVITYGIVLPGPEVEHGVPYVRQQDVRDSGILVDQLRHTTREIASKHERSSLAAGDILLCIIRNLRVATVPASIAGANITQGMVRLRPEASVVHGSYLAAYLASTYAQSWMRARYFGMDMPRINVEDARAVPVAVPPLEEQAEIVRVVGLLFRAADEIEQGVAAATARADKLTQAILAKAFRGELVPTEAELARAEGRQYETGAQLLERIQKAAAVTEAPVQKSSSRKSAPGSRAKRTRNAG